MVLSLDRLTPISPNWTNDALYYEFSSAVAPKLPPIPCTTFPAQLHYQGRTRIIPLDLCDQLQCNVPAITPNLSAYFLRICTGEDITTNSYASAQLFYVIRGAGRTKTEYGAIAWLTGDIFTLPACGEALLEFIP